LTNGNQIIFFYGMTNIIYTLYAQLNKSPEKQTMFKNIFVMSCFCDDC